MRAFFITILSFCMILFSASTAPCVDEIIIITEPTIEKTPQEFKQKKIKSLKDNLNIRGFIQTKGAVDTNNDAANEHDYTFYNNARLEGKWTFEGSRNYIFGSIDSEYLWFGTHNDEDDYDLDLFEGYFYWSKKRVVKPRFRRTPIRYGIKQYFSWLRGPVDIRVGRQIVRWGKTPIRSALWIT